MIVRVSLAGSEEDWAIQPDEHTGAPQAQWVVVMGRDRFRLYGTAAVPTGLFRLSDTVGGTGIMTLNAGALFRLVWLSNEGHESPIGLEAGVMWVNIAGGQTATNPATTASQFGDVAIVAGVGVGVPIANASRLHRNVDQRPRLDRA